MDHIFWHRKWEKQEIGFHLNETHQSLVDFGHFLPPGKVIVPLCGKSKDLLWLRDQGHFVYGAELSAIACKNFFEENKLPFRVTHESGFEIYRSERIEIWCGDFFATPELFWKDATSLYDRAAMIALPPDMRAQYVHKIMNSRKEICPELEVILLIALEYSKNLIPGPPFSVVETEIAECYAPAFELKTLRSEALPDFASGNPSRDSSVLEAHAFEKTYLLS